MNIDIVFIMLLIILILLYMNVDIVFIMLLVIVMLLYMNEDIIFVVTTNYLNIIICECRHYFCSDY